MLNENIEEDWNDEDSLDKKLSKLNRKVQPFRFIDEVNRKAEKPTLESYSHEINRSNIYQEAVSSIFKAKKAPGSIPDSKVNTMSNYFECHESEQDKPQIKLCRNARKKLTIQKKSSSHDPLQGQGVIKLKDGKTVFGTWKDGVLLGNARIVYPKGGFYIGEVKQNNLRHGKGTYIFKDGCKYQGQFKDGRCSGLGVLLDQFGEVLNKGVWNEGELVKHIY